MPIYHKRLNPIIYTVSWNSHCQNKLLNGRFWCSLKKSEMMWNFIIEESGKGKLWDCVITYQSPSRMIMCFMSVCLIYTFMTNQIFTYFDSAKRYETRELSGHALIPTQRAWSHKEINDWTCSLIQTSRFPKWPGHQIQFKNDWKHNATCVKGHKCL